MSKRTIILAVLPEQAGQKVMTFLKSLPDTRDAVPGGAALWGTVDNARREIDRTLAGLTQGSPVGDKAMMFYTVDVPLAAGPDD